MASQDSADMIIPDEKKGKERASEDGAGNYGGMYGQRNSIETENLPSYPDQGPPLPPREHTPRPSREPSPHPLTSTQSSELTYAPPGYNPDGSDTEDGQRLTVPPNYSEAPASGQQSPGMRPPSVHSLTPSEAQAVQNELSLPSVLFAIPFPPPRGKTTKTTNIPFLLYTLPRSVYKKPGAAKKEDDGAVTPAEGSQDLSASMSRGSSGGADGAQTPDKKSGAKPPKEKLIKKVERMWQEEVEAGQKIHRGEIRDATTWQQMKGGMARAAGKAIDWMPNSVIQALGRLPPVKKLGQIRVVYPSMPYPDLPNAEAVTNEEIDEKMMAMLLHAKKNATRTRWISGALLPVTVAIDAINPFPLFLAEVNGAHFAMIYNGAKKITGVTSSDSRDSFTYEPVPSPTTPPAPSSGDAKPDPSAAAFFDPITSLVYDHCSRLAPGRFPVPPSHRPYPATGRALSSGLVAAFKDRLPPEIWERHQLDEERIAEDIEKAVSKGCKEYVKSLGKA